MSFVDKRHAKNHVMQVLRHYTVNKSKSIDGKLRKIENKKKFKVNKTGRGGSEVLILPGNAFISSLSTSFCFSTNAHCSRVSGQVFLSTNAWMM